MLLGSVLFPSVFTPPNRIVDNDKVPYRTYACYEHIAPDNTLQLQYVIVRIRWLDLIHDLRHSPLAIFGFFFWLLRNLRVEALGECVQSTVPRSKIVVPNIDLDFRRTSPAGY